MAAHASSDDAHADPKPPPGLPEIQDEAADTPLWIPALGLALFVLAALWLVISSAIEDMSGEEIAPEVNVAAEAPADLAGEPTAD